MCGTNPQQQLLDEQRLTYVYQGLNVVLKLLNQHLESNQQDTLTEAYLTADSGQIIAMAAMALKNGNITKNQYEKIFDAAMGINTVETQAYRENTNHRHCIKGHAFLNQYRR